VLDGLRLKEGARRLVLTQHNLDPVHAPVVGQRYGPISRQRRIIKADPGHPPADPVGVVDGDLVDGVTVTVGDLEVFPPSGNARIDAEGGTSLPKSENPL
jgi:hypothetical protein